MSDPQDRHSAPRSTDEVPPPDEVSGDDADQVPPPGGSSDQGHLRMRPDGELRSARQDDEPPGAAL